MLGRVVRVDYDDGCDSVLDSRARYFFKERVRILSDRMSFSENPCVIEIDGDTDGSWDTWLTRLGTTGSDYRVDLDLDGDGTSDRSFTASILGLERAVREAFWRPVLCRRYDAAAVPKKLPDASFLTDRLAERLLSEELVSEEAYADYWRKVFDMDEEQGADLFPAQMLVGGHLPKLAYWPQPQRRRFDQLVAQGNPERVARKQARDEYWAATWNE